MEVLKFSENSLNIKIDIEKVLIRLKLNKISNNKDSIGYKNIEKIILQEIQKFYTLIKIIAVYSVFNKEDSFYLYKESVSVQKLLKDSEKVIFFAVSLGHKIDDKISEFLDTKQIFYANIWDSIATEAVEELANVLNNKLKNNFLLLDFLTTMRYSPGYGDWGLEKNFYFFEILELEKEGIKITDSGLFIPQKTITAIFGLIKRGE